MIMGGNNYDIDRRPWCVRIVSLCTVKLVTVVLLSIFPFFAHASLRLMGCQCVYVSIVGSGSAFFYFGVFFDPVTSTAVESIIEISTSPGL